MISIEMIVMLSVYVVFFAAVMSLINAMILNYRIQTATNETAKEIAAYAAFGGGSGSDVSKAQQSFETLKGLSDGEPSADRTEYLCAVAAQPEKLQDYISMIFRSVILETDPDFVDHMRATTTIGGITRAYGNIASDGELTVTIGYQMLFFKVPFTENSWFFYKNMACSATTRAWIP